MIRKQCVLFLALCATAAAMAQDRSKQDPQSAVEPRSGPGVGQKFLAKFVGQWEVEKTFYGRDGNGAKSKGTCTQEMTQGSRFLRSEFTFEGASGQSTGTGVIGFETSTGMFTSVWYDSRATRMSFRRSKDKFDGKEIVLHGAGLGSEQTRQSRTVTHLEDDGKRIIHRQYNRNPDGTERLLMQLVLTKKTGAEQKNK